MENLLHIILSSHRLHHVMFASHFTLQAFYDHFGLAIIAFFLGDICLVDPPWNFCDLVDPKLVVLLGGPLHDYTIAILLKNPCNRCYPYGNVIILGVTEGKLEYARTDVLPWMPRVEKHKRTLKVWSTLTKARGLRFDIVRKQEKDLHMLHNSCHFLIEWYYWALRILSVDKKIHYWGKYQIVVAIDRCGNGRLEPMKAFISKFHLGSKCHYHRWPCYREGTPHGNQTFKPLGFLTLVDAH